jgi:hypothetical protein
MKNLGVNAGFINGFSFSFHFRPCYFQSLKVLLGGVMTKHIKVIVFRRITLIDFVVSVWIFELKPTAFASFLTIGIRLVPSLKYQ